MAYGPAEVSRIVDAGLAQGYGGGWLERLTLEQLVRECEVRRLPPNGTVSTLRARIRTYERGVEVVRENISAESDRLDLQTRDEGGAAKKHPHHQMTPVSREEYREGSRGPEWPRNEAGVTRDLMGTSTPRGETAGATGAIKRETSHQGMAGQGRRTQTPSTLPPLEIAKWMRQWDVTFSGARGADAEGFLRKLRKLRAIIPVADQDLFTCLSFYLKGVALSWFEEKQARITTWEEFEESFRHRFALRGSRAILAEEIRDRTQGEAEPVADYFACLYALFRQLDPPWTEEEKLDRAHDNLLPRIQMWLPRRHVRNVDDLERLAINVEEDLYKASRYKAPPPPERVVCPEWAYHPPRRPARSHVAVEAERSPPPGKRDTEGGRARDTGHPTWDARRDTGYQTRDTRRDAGVPRCEVSPPSDRRDRPRLTDQPAPRRSHGIVREDPRGAQDNHQQEEPPPRRGWSSPPRRRQQEPREQPPRRGWSPTPRRRQPEPREEPRATPARGSKPARPERAGGITCWRCGLVGHYARECPEPPICQGPRPTGHHGSCCDHQCAGNARRRE